MRRLALFACVAVALAPRPAMAVEAMAVTAVDISAFPEVTATLAVPPSLAGRTVPGSAFSVDENGTLVVPTVTPLPAEELEVILVVDTSGSMAGSAIEAAKRSAEAFLAAMPPATRIAVVGFGEVPVLASGFSLDRAALGGALGGLVAKGETALYDAVAMAVAQFPPNGATRSLVLLSDGGDTTSRTPLAAVTDMLANAKVRVDAVELASSEANHAALASLAAAGGGSVAPAGDPAALDAIYRGLAATLANQYRLSFRSAASGPTQVRVAMTHEGVSAEGVVAFDAPVAPSPPTTVVPPAPSRSIEPGAVDGRLLASGAVAFFVAMYLAGLAVVLPRNRRTARLARLGHSAPQPASGAAGAISELAGRATHAADAALERRGRRGVLNGALERAGVALRPGEYVVLCVSGVVIALLTGVFLSGLLLGVVLATFVGLASRIALGVMAGRRQSRFADQLSDTLQVMVGSLRAGYGLLQVFDTVAKEALSPTAEEFRRVVVESRLGRDLPESLHAMADRVASEDFEWVVGAIEINREVGGDLAEVLETVAGTIRERDYIRRQVKSLSAEGRLSAYILLALPFVVLLLLRIVNPTYMAELGHGVGLVMSAVGAGFMALGAMWLRKICRLVY